MPRRLRSTLTYSNVVSTICLFLLLGGAAYAATKLAKNSVGSAQIKANAVSSSKIANNAVTGGKIAVNAVTTGKIADNAVTTGKIADNAVTTGKIADNAVTTGKIADNAVTTGQIADNAVTGRKVKVSSLHFSCNNPTDATLILGGPCVYKRVTGGDTWVQAINACQVGAPGATLPTVAQVEAYAPLGGVPWKSVGAFTSELTGNGPNPSGAWSVTTDANGNVNVIVGTPLTNNVQRDVLCVYDPASTPAPGS